MDVLAINKDIVIDGFGDIVIQGGDILVTSNKDEIAKCNSMHRIMSSNGDLYLHFLYGANIQSFIGKGITDETAESIQLSIENSLIEDMFLSRDMYQIQYVLDIDKILFKIAIGTDDGFTNEKSKELNISISSTGAVSYV